MSLYLGKGQVAICSRCGWKSKRSALKEDGRLKNLLVCSTCWDPDHPLDYPAPPRSEGLPPYRPAPENDKHTAPVLTLTLDGTARDLTWTAAEFGGGLVSRYDVYRSIAGADFALLDSFSNTFSSWGALLTETLAYSDEDLTGFETGDTLSYYVVAVSTDNRTTRSNTVSTAADVPVVPEGMNIPLVFNEQDYSGLVTLTRSGYKSITPDGFVCNGYDNRLATTSIPANLQSATAELGFQVSMYHFGGEVRASSREVVACLGLNDASSTPKAEIFVDADPTDINDPRVGFATRVGGVRTEFRLNRSRWQFQWRRHEATIGGEQCYVQGIEYDPDSGNMIYAVSANDIVSRIYEVDISTGDVLRQFDFSSATHFNSISRRDNGQWWFCDSLNENFRRVDMEASFVAGTAVVLQTVTHNLAEEGPCHCFVTIGGTEYLVTGEYATTGFPFINLHLASLLDSSTTITDVNRVKRFASGYRNQGVAVGPDGYLYFSYGQGTYTGGRILRIDPDALLATADNSDMSALINLSRAIVPPTNYPEDLTFDADGWMWCGTESDITFEDDMNFNCLWRAKLYEQSTDADQTYFKGFPLNTYTCNYDGAGTWQILMNGRLFREFSATPDVTPAMITIGGPIQASASGTNGFFRGVISGVHAGPDQVTAEQVPIFAKGAYETSVLTAYSFPAFNDSFEIDTSGWTAETGAMGRRTTNPPPFDTSDSAYGFGGTTVQCIARQRFATSALTDGSGNAMTGTLMDGGGVWFVNSFLTASFTNHGDSCSVGFRFLNSSQVQLSFDQGEIYSPLPDLIWKYRANNAQTPPSGTRYVDLVYRSDRTDGTNNDGYVDKIRAYAFRE